MTTQMQETTAKEIAKLDRANVKLYAALDAYYDARPRGELGTDRVAELVDEVLCYFAGGSSDQRLIASKVLAVVARRVAGFVEAESAPEA